MPTLSNVALTAPYFHNGSEPSLVEAAFFRTHGKNTKEPQKQGEEALMFLRRFSDKGIEELTAFMQALPGELLTVEVPQKPPSQPLPPL